MEKDAPTGLDHTPFRKYDSGWGRWTSPDPYGGSMSASDPQTFNRYSYVSNDPVNRVDPSGLMERICDAEGNCYPWEPPVATAYSGADSLSLFGGYFTPASQGRGAGLSFAPLRPAPAGEPPVIGPEPQSPAPSPTPQQTPLHCQPDIIKAMEKAWMRSGNGTRNTEAGFVPYRGSDGKIGTANLPNTNQDKRISFKFSEILPKGATPLAIFHTHPNAGGEKPSTGDPPSDVDTATRTGLPVYVISNRGLNIYDPATRKTSEVRDNLDWLKPCK